MSGTIRIRMYNVGFGDSFLLTLPDKKTILVDAGFHSQGKGKFGGNELVEQVITDLKAISGRAHIDVVIATHRHQDHVFCFNSTKWDEVSIGEVWLPWVEDRGNTAATKLWKKKQQFAMQLFAALPSFALDPATNDAVQFMLWNAGVDVPGFAAAGDNWSNENALDTLHEGFKQRDRPKPRFLPETQTFPEAFQSPALPGVSISVIGPSRDPDLIEELDPTADGESYKALALRAANLPGAPQVRSIAAPFGPEWQVGDDEPGMCLDGLEVERLNALAHSADALLAAQKLDDMINSTSLVLILEIGSARLLLPGDAEWGTWKRILKNDDAKSLVKSATFFKVGHHGSHNATPKSLIEQVLKRKIPAMISTQQGPGKYRNNIPLQEVLDAFTAHDYNVVRSDRTDGALPAGFTKGTDASWVDLELPC